MTSITAELRSRIAGDTVSDGSPPSLEFIKALVEDRTGYFKAFHGQCKEEDEYYFLERKIPVPQDADFDDFIYPATATAIIEVATDHVDVNNITIDVPLMLRSKARAEKIKKALQGIWLNIRGPQKRTIVKHQFQYGIAFARPMFDPDNWPDAPRLDDFGAEVVDGEMVIFNEAGYIEAQKDFLQRRKMLFPLVLQNFNPQSMLWDDSRQGPKWAIHKRPTRAGEVRRMYPQWISRKDDKEPTEWWEYWDDIYFAYLVDGTFILPPTPHGYGFQPFIPVIPGSAIDWDEGPPERRYRGMLRPVHNLLDAEARLATQAEAILRTVAYRTLDFTGAVHAANDAADRYELWGGKNVLPPNVTVQASPMLNLPPDLLTQMGMVQTMIEAATFPSVVRGQQIGGVSSGFNVSVRAGMGRLRFQPVADGTAHGIEKINQGWLSIIENRIRSSVTVNARSEIHQFDETIRPDDIRGYRENVVSLKAEAPEERERESMLAERLHQAGIISLYETQRRVGIVNPLEEQVQIAAEKLLGGARDQQLEEFLARIGKNQQDQLVEAAGQSVGNQFRAGQSQLQRPGERNIQQARSASREGRPSVFPQGQGGINLLGSLLGSAPGGAQGTPSGPVVR